MMEPRVNASNPWRYGSATQIQPRSDAVTAVDLGGASLTTLGDLTFQAGTNTVAGIENQNLLDKTAAETVAGVWTLTTPTIASFVNATHDHQDAAGGGQLDHGAALTGLSDDDHAQYVRGGGRSSGQSVTGGTAATEHLSLEPNSVGGSTGRIKVIGTSYDYGSNKAIALSTFDGGLTVAGNSLAVNAVLMSGTVNLSSSSFVGFPITSLLYTDSVVTGANSGVAALPAPRAVYSSPTLQNSFSGAMTAGYFGFYSDPLFDAGTGTLTAANTYGVWSRARTAGAKITNHFDFFSKKTSGAAGDMTNHYGLYVDADTTATNAFSVVSAGSATEMRHVGPAVFGSTAAATASTAVEIKSTTGALLLPRMTTTQRNALTATNGMMIYNTTNLVVEAYENGAWVNL